jgi:hypothetical protein
MTIQYQQSVAHFENLCTVEEAEELLQWLQTHPQGKVNLKACTHLHASALQVLLAAQPQIIEWPEDLQLACWLKPLFNARSGLND